MAVFRVTREGSGDWSRRLDLPDALGNIKRRLKFNGGPFRAFNFKSGEFAPGVKLDPIMASVEFRLKKDVVGDIERIKCKNEVVIRVKRVKPMEVKLPTGADSWHRIVQDVYKLVFSHFPTAENWGVINCRRANHDPTIWSQHAFGRAIDIHPTNGSMTEGDAIKKKVREGQGDRVNIVWRSAAHFDHLHIEVNPRATGTPECA